MAFELGTFASKLSSTRPRTIETVTEEILDIKQRVSEDFMALGQRLCEAKELLPHGEWLPWLANNVQFSERQAQKFMALARGYEANPQLAADFGSEKAFALLDLPMEEREEIAKNGVEVDGKTKSTADLTTREVKQIVADRKQDLHKKAEVQDNFSHQTEQNEKFEQMLYRFRNTFLPALKVCDDRKDGIFVLKERFKYSASGSKQGGWRGTKKGLGLYGDDFHCIERTWTEVWEMLAVIALQGVSTEFNSVEGQLSIARWMPGGTNPGRESGWCCTITRLPCNVTPRPQVMWWDGALAQWKSGKTGDVVKTAPDAWMRLPEWHE